MKSYYYISGTAGMKPNGSFTSDPSKWLIFTEEDKNRIGNQKPYGATKYGSFVETTKY